MGVRIRRIADQTREFLNLLDEDGKKRAAVDVDGKYFGDASRITGILKPFQPQPLVVDDDSSGTASDNAETIQAALNAAANDFEIDTIKLPNAKFFCDQIKLGFVRTGELEIERVDHSGLTIEGGGKTFVVNKYHPVGFGVFFGEPFVIGYYDRIIDYQPGEPDVTEVTIQSADPYVGVSQYAEGMFVYVFPQYFRQSITHSRDCQLNSIESITPGSGDIAVTFRGSLPTDLQATLATAILNSGEVDSVVVGVDVGAGYETLFPPRVHFSGGEGSGAVAKAIIGSGAVVAINVTTRGSGYASRPTVTITTITGETGSGATGTAYQN